MSAGTRRILALVVPSVIVIVVVAVLLSRGGSGNKVTAGPGPSTSASVRVSASPTPTPDASDSVLAPSRSVDRSPSPTPTPTPKKTTAKKTTPPAPGSLPCTAATTTLVVRPSFLHYAAGVTPTFTASLRTTDLQGCVVAGQVALIVTQGSVRVWSSADCNQFGVPIDTALPGATRTFTWNRRHSTPGCVPAPARSPLAAAGTYRVRAVWGNFTSLPAVFTLA